ncbi:hypothetical protein [Gordonia sp. NPDC003429]
MTMCTQHADTILLVMDGSVRAHSVARQVLSAGKHLVVTGSCSRDLLPYVDAAVHDRTWVAIADPACPDQIDEVIDRATEMSGPVIMIVDPGGLLTDVATADRRAA